MESWKGSNLRLAWVGLGLAVAAGPLWAASSQIWRHRTRAEREQGDLKGVSLLNDGTLTLGPAFDTLAKSPDPYFWSLARDSRGNIFAGSGNEGKVYRLGKDGQLTLYFDSGELEVHALAVDAKDLLYVGTSPRGKIYRLDSSGKGAEFFSPGETYIWSLLFDREGNLYAGTGTGGKIFRVTPSGKGEVFLDTDETHIRVLALDADGNLLAGTDGNGLLLRVDAKGRSAVVTHAPLNEITAMAVGSGGRVYLAAAGQAAARPQQRPPAPPSAPRTSSPPVPGAPEEEKPPGQPSEPPQQPAAIQSQVSAPQPPSGPPVESRILSVENDGYAREIWTTSGDLILSLALDRDGNVVAGAGTDGKIYRIDPVRADSTLLNKADSSQISVLLPEPGGSILAAGSNLGALYRLGGKVASEGTYESSPYDARVYSTWGKVAWRAETLAGSSVRIQVRTGNTADPDATWSDWSAFYDKGDGTEIDRPRSRYVQWRATLRSSDGHATPRLGEVMVNYLQRNLPPEIRSVEIQPPGVVYQKPNKAEGVGDGSVGPKGAEKDKVAKRQIQQPRPQTTSEGRAVQWSASDPNGDDLLFSVYFRGVDEKKWKLMEEKLTDPFYSWDVTAMADGTYLLRVVADDSPSNPGSAALSAERLGDPFDVDNNPPQIGAIKTSLSGSSASLEFEVSDSFSNVGVVEYSVNAGDWKAVYPRDGISDSRRESYRVDLGRLDPGEYSVVVKANDAAGNSATARTVLETPASR